MTSGRYKYIRNLAWKFLLKNKVTNLPVDIAGILCDSGIVLYAYNNPAAVKILSVLGIIHMIESELAIIIKLDGQHCLFYDNRQRLSRLRFTLAHEIGHVYLGHCFDVNTHLGRSRIYKTDKPPYEKEADMFAARILAPLCVIKELNIDSVENLIRLTGLSREAASHRFDRYLEVVKPRNKFYLHPDEVNVRKQFEEFIKNYKLI